MNDLQKVEFEILKVFVNICNRLNLRYYLVCGSALGAAKYGGFIPWDDDIDVAMPRKDYSIFCEKATKMLPQHLFLQNCHTEKNYPYIYSKIRDSRTTYIEKGMSKLDINHGVYIDLFPLDGYPDDIKEQQKLEKKKRRHQLIYLSCLTIDLPLKVRVFVFAEKILCIPRKAATYAKNFEKIISAYPLENSKYWCNHGNWQGHLEYAPFEQYGNGTMVKFEGLDVRIPAKYDQYLTQKYGDWRADIPESQKQGHHYYKVCDLEKPYIYYWNL